MRKLTIKRKMRRTRRVTRLQNKLLSIFDNKRLDGWDRLLTGLCTDYKLSKGHGFVELAAIHNAGIFLISLQRDIVILREQLLLANHKQTESVLARHISIAIYEGAKDLPIIFGKKYRDALTSVGVENIVLGDLGKIMKPISEFFLQV